MNAQLWNDVEKGCSNTQMAFYIEIGFNDIKMVFQRHDT